jgi:hypothetical protein
MCLSSSSSSSSSFRCRAGRQIRLLAVNPGLVPLGRAEGNGRQDRRREGQNVVVVSRVRGIKAILACFLVAAAEDAAERAGDAAVVVAVLLELVGDVLHGLRVKGALLTLSFDGDVLLEIIENMLKYYI